MDLSIIIVSWNTRDLLVQCFDSIFAHLPYCEFEVWVVDNASSDGSAAMVRERFPQVRLIENRENVGFARANNQGIRCSAGRHLLLLNSDTRMYAGALEKIVTHLDQNPAVGIVGVRLLNLDGSIQSYPTAFPNLQNQTVMLWYLPGRQKFLVGQSNSPRACEVERVKGACLAVRRQVIDAIGPMDETLFLYAEEDDLCYRARQAGWQVSFLPDVLVTHLGAASTDQISEQALIYLYQGKLWFVRKYYGNAQARLLKLVIALSYIVRGLIGFIDFTERNSVRSRGRSYLRLLQELDHL